MEAQDQGWMVESAAWCILGTGNLRRFTTMGNRLVHNILLCLDLVLSALVLGGSTTPMVHCHEGRDKTASATKGGTMTLTAVDAYVDCTVDSRTRAVAPITTATQLQDLSDLDRGVGHGDGNGLYILRSVTMHGDPPPPPEPPPWINCSPSTNVEDPVSSIVASLKAHGDISLRNGKAVDLWTTFLAVNRLTVPSYDKEWNMIGTGKCATRLMGLVCLGVFLLYCLGVVSPPAAYGEDNCDTSCQVRKGTDGGICWGD